MKTLHLVCAVNLCLLLALMAHAQPSAPQGGGAARRPGGIGMGPRARATSATLLLAPADWRFETMPLPPRFAPGVKFTGVEEARFAPGMFDTTATNYFTYVLALSVEGTENVDAAGMKDFLETYYRGLLGGLGQRKGLTVDPAQIKAEIAAAQPQDKSRSRYQGKVAIIDTFSDGRKTSLNVEADVLPQPALKKTCIILLLSPQPQDSDTWKNLRAIRDKINFEGR